jgi:hypothetical protein
MPYKTSWFIEQRAVQIELIGEVTLEDMAAYSAILHDDYLEKGEAPVHMVFNLQNLQRFPSQVLAIKKTSDLYMHHPALGWAIFVGINNPLMSFLANTVAQTLKIKSQQAKTLDEALEKLKRIDPQLKDATT